MIKGDPEVEVLNGVSLHDGLVASWPIASPVTAQMTMASLIEHWREFGLPAYAQFDNDLIFHGAYRYPDALGRVIRLCLSLGVVPVFVPPRDRLPGHDRELQRLVADQGLVAVPA